MQKYALTHMFSTQGLAPVSAGLLESLGIRCVTLELEDESNDLHLHSQNLTSCAAAYFPALRLFKEK